jgi:DNA (cytosine-5)-methyltransferase 1
MNIGTDCSGIEAPIQALQQLNVKFNHLWSCDNDIYAIKSIKANYHPNIIFDNILNRNHNLLPDIDIYVCGFPCQSFSLLGKKQGLNDPRGTVMFECINVIKIKKPKVFILENVKHFINIDNKQPYNYLINQLQSIFDENNNDSYYNLYSFVYNTNDYGIPQTRNRIYIVGIAKHIQLREFVKPMPIECQPLENFILDKNYNNEFKVCNTIKKKLINIDTNKLYICSCENYRPASLNMSPTLTASISNNMYVTKYNRYLSIKECLLLQGFPTDFKQVVSNTQLFKQIGNTMSVNVLKAIFKEIFDSTKF